MTSAESTCDSPIRREWLGRLATCALAIGLTVIFWLPIWCGAGFVGGDIYSYFFPQKVIYAEALHAGELPLWNSHAGFGYPLLAESQTGIFYPPNLVLYQLLEVHSAFHVSFLLHYFLAFVFASAAARRLGLSLLPSWLTALIYVYGWFPPRTCVEWAIIGGTWMPAALWCAESFLASRLWRYAIALSGVLAVQLLAGHFQIAWFTLLLLTAYVPARTWWCGVPSAFANGRPEPESTKPRRGRVAVVAFTAIGLGIALAAIQLLPTYELKQRSQRAAVGKTHELEFGSIPPWYWTQMIRPSHWYSPLTDREEAFRERPPLGHARTNSTEAHLYFGVAPLLLSIVAVVLAWRERNRHACFWLSVALLSGIYTSGWLLPVTQYLPGFSYFQGPGRYGLLTTWAMAVVVGFVVDRFLREPFAIRWLAWTMFAGVLWSSSTSYFLADDVAAVIAQFQIRNPLAPLLTSAHEVGPLLGLFQLSVLAVVFCSISGVFWWLSERPSEIDARLGLIGLMLLTTAIEFWTISRLVTFTQIVESPPLKSLEQSPVRQKLLEVAKARPTLRLFAPGANLPSALGVSCAPIYLTFGPKEYVDPMLTLPDAPGTSAVPATREQLNWLIRCGVTHVLSFERPAMTSAMNLLWQGDDPFLNRAWGRSGQPLYLYEIKNSIGRLQFYSMDSQAISSNSWKPVRFESRSNQVSCSVELVEAGMLVLADLDYPGWTVAVDGQIVEPIRFGGQFRGVRLEAGAHQVAWSYQPHSFRWGAAISVVTFALLAAIAHVRFWHPERMAWLDEGARVKP